MKRELAILLLTASAVACSGATNAEPPMRDTAPSSPGVGASPTSLPAEGPPTRMCESHVVGDISGWRRHSTIVGPIGFAGLTTYADAPDRFFRSRGERYRTLKSLLIVERGPAVTIRILQPDRARLLYDPGGWTSQTLYRLEQAEPEMVFEPCDFLRRTQFNGAWLVTGRTCVTIEVTVAGREPERAEVPLGLACDG